MVSGLFGSKTAPLLGIDVSSSSVKLVELSLDKSETYVLERCAIEPLEKGWVVDGNIENFDEVVDAIKRVVKKSGSKTKNVALALPASAVITKKIVLAQGLTEKELETQVEAEANQYIPFSMDEVSLDFCVLGENSNSPEEMDVLIAASRKEKVQDRRGLAEAASLKPIILDVETFASRTALERQIEALPNGGSGKLIALFEIGSMTTGMQIIRDGELLYERDQAFGGGQLTQLIVRQYGFSREEAELKKRSSSLPSDYTNTVLAPFVDNLSQEISRALQFFFTSTPHNRVDYIMLAGGSASLNGLPSAIKKQTTFSCKVINPFDGMIIKDESKYRKITNELPSYLTACGLAMRRFL